MDKQKAVFINAMKCDDIEKLECIAKELTKNGQPDSVSAEVDLHTWQADTKYYVADIVIAILKEKSIMDMKFSDGVEAVLLYFNSGKDQDGLSKMQSWLPFVTTWKPSIALAVCEKCDSDGNGTLRRASVQEWCLENGFELVELNPDPDDYDEFEDVGTKRIKSALLAHMWPNMVLKEAKNAVKLASKPCGVEAAKSPTVGVDESQNYIDQLLGKENEFDDVIGDENEQDNFEKLFSKLKVMKDQASSLPEDQRKKYAENMVRAFWTALGGDDEEFAGLSSDDETGTSTEKA